MMRYACVLLVACGATQHAAEPKPDVRAEVRDAETAERARQHDVARRRYEHAVADAKDADSIAFARGHFGETLATWGEYHDAIVQLEAAVAAMPNDASNWYNLGIVRNHEAKSMADLRSAQDALERSEKLAPADWRPRIALSAMHWSLAVGCYCGVSARNEILAQHDSPPTSCARDADAAKAEYRALLELDIPDRVRAKIGWALDQLARDNAGLDPAAACKPTP